MAEQQGIQSVEAGLRVLYAMVDSARPMSLKEIATAAHMTSSNTHRYMVSFVRAEMARQDPLTGRYELGPFALRLGLAAFAGVDALEEAGKVLHELRAEIDLPVFLSVWTPYGPTMVRWLEASHAVAVNIRPGSRAPLLISASGRVFMAYGNQSQQQALLAEELRLRRERGEATLVTLDEVEALRRETRRHGLGRVIGERVAGINGLSVPVFNAMGELAVSMTSVGLAHAFKADYNGPIAHAIRAAGERASARLGYRKPRAGAAAPTPDLGADS